MHQASELCLQPTCFFSMLLGCTPAISCSTTACLRINWITYIREPYTIPLKTCIYALKLHHSAPACLSKSIMESTIICVFSQSNRWLWYHMLRLMTYLIRNLHNLHSTNTSTNFVKLWLHVLWNLSNQNKLYSRWPKKKRTNEIHILNLIWQESFEKSPLFDKLNNWLIGNMNLPICSFV